jgi:hypothetical protein
MAGHIPARIGGQSLVLSGFGWSALCWMTWLASLAGMSWHWPSHASI